MNYCLKVKANGKKSSHQISLTTFKVIN